MANPGALLGQAAALFEARRFDEAAVVCDRLLAFKPPPPDALHLAGLVAWQRGDVSRGMSLLRQAIKVSRPTASLHANLATCLVAGGEASAAIEHVHAALRLDPRWMPAHAALSDALLAMGAVHEAVNALRQALALEPSPNIHSNALYAMAFSPTWSVREVVEEHRAWARAWAGHLPARVAHDNDRDPERRLRVGYLSGDMMRHSVASFLAPLLEAHDRSVVEVHAFPSVKRPDAVTARLRELCDGWTPVLGLPDAEAAQRIRAAKIDVLVELGGHTGESRLLVMAHRPAPVQVTWLGYPNTTGLPQIDYRLVDADSNPEGEADRLYPEKLVRLPRGFLSYEPPADAPDVAPPPSESTGAITFGSFNTLAKTSPRAIETWARVLKKVDGSRLLLKSMALGDPGVRARVAQQFAAHGIDASRLSLDGHVASPGAHLARYGALDVALDPFPYNGTTTTCEALWMGVPVVALDGDRHVARVTGAILRHVGLGELVAPTTKDYVSLAAALAKDAARLRSLRATMRDRLRASPLLDHAGFARSIEAAYRDMWRAWCASPPSA